MLRKAADTHSDHVLITAWPRKQWLRDNASIVHYTFIAYLSITNCCKFSVLTQNFVPIETNFVTSVNFNRSGKGHLYVYIYMYIYIYICTLLLPTGTLWHSSSKMGKVIPTQAQLLLIPTAIFRSYSDRPVVSRTIHKDSQHKNSACLSNYLKL